MVAEWVSFFVLKIVRYVDEILDFIDGLELVFGRSFECWSLDSLVVLAWFRLIVVCLQIKRLNYS